MKRLLQVLAFVFCSTTIFAQLNMDLVGQLDYNTDLSDIWGWVDPDDGTEYAIVGLFNGTSVVSLADPSNPIEVQFIPGGQSTWRDIKTWGDFAYVTTDQNGTTDGLLVIDLTNAPDNITWFNWNPTIAGQVLNTCHNIYIDEFGFAYLAGCNNNNGGMVIVDVFTTPGDPVLEALAPPAYSHDVFTRDNLMYSSEINAGHLGIYDVSDKNNITLLATQPTPFDFTHNAWLSDDSNTVFTTDEKANAPVAAYDISDLDNIVELDQFLPVETIGENVIPHNVHVWDDWLLISYYTDGGIVVDASNPSNLIEVGNFDTFLGGNGGFNGAWGLYPFLPSGLIIVSDINSGLYVLQPNLVNACWLEGFVTDANTGNPIFNATVVIDSPQANIGTSDLVGEYKTGQAIPGVFDVTFTANNYLPKTVSATLENGVITLLDVELENAVQQVSLSGQVVKDGSGQPIAGAYVRFSNDEAVYEATTAGDGTFSFNGFFVGNYDVFSGAWGCLHHTDNINVDADNALTIELEEGYQDDFFADFDWTLQNQGATTGDWELGDPIGANFNGQQSNPENDAANDIGSECYATGNGGGNGGANDIDGGDTQIISPVMDLSTYNLPVMTFSYWFYNDGGQGEPVNDQLEIRISNGTDEAVIFNTTESNSQWFDSPEFIVSDFIALTNNMTLIVESGDQNPGHIVEAGFDKFLITDSSLYPPFSVSSTFACAMESIQFADQSDSTATYSWVFEGGNPATSNVANPTVTYDAAGTYDVSLTVVTDEGTTYELENSDLIIIGTAPAANFTFNTTGSVVDFSNTSIAGDSFFWDFGDNETSTETNPSHTYNGTGIFMVTLTTTNACGESTETFSVEINSVPPVAGFNISNTAGCVPFEVTFTDVSTGSPSTWQWAIPGSSDESSTEQNPTVTYNTAGTYSVSLMVTNAAGDSDVLESQVIVVQDAPMVDFSTSIGDDGEVIFNNLTEGGTEFSWDFGDNNGSTEENPTYVYDEPGDYEVTLTATNDCGETVYTETVLVMITGVADIYKTLEFTVFPNPFAETIAIEFTTETALENGAINIFNALGQLIETHQVTGNNGVVAVGEKLFSGVYFVELTVDGTTIKQEKIVKMK